MAGLFDALIQQESGGRPGVRGPKTRWGRALGLTQMLPATAQEMARKVGVPWQPEMMTAKDERGAAYQRKLGEAYFNEGLEKTGNERDALRYYHGGPNRKQWGPKTNAYADQVLARAGDDSMMQPMRNQPRPMMRGMPQQGYYPADPITQALQGQDAPDPQIGGQMMAQQQQPNFAAASQPVNGVDPLAPTQKPKAFGKGGAGWSILGILGDALSAYGGQNNGTFAKSMMAKAEGEREENMFQRKLEAERQMKREAMEAKLAEPPSWQQDAQAFARLPDEVKQQVISFRDAMYPVVADVANPDGSVFRQQMPRSLGPQGGPKPGAVEDGYEYIGGDPANPQSWRRR